MRDERRGDEFTANLVDEIEAMLATARDAESMAKVVAEAAAAAEEPCRGRPMACAAGCPYCCVLNVAVLLPEAMTIAAWLAGRFTPDALTALREALAEHRSWARWMDDEERIIKKAFCPLLDSAGSCSVHPVRPLACRGVTSLDSESCKEAFDPVITDEMRLVPADLLRKETYDEAFTALANALGNAGFDDRSIELGSGVLLFLEHPHLRELFLQRGRLPDEPWR